VNNTESSQLSDPGSVYW